MFSHRRLMIQEEHFTPEQTAKFSRSMRRFILFALLFNIALLLFIVAFIFNVQNKYQKNYNIRPVSCESRFDASWWQVMFIFSISLYYYWINPPIIAPIETFKERQANSISKPFGSQIGSAIANSANNAAPMSVTTGENRSASPALRLSTISDAERADTSDECAADDSVHIVIQMTAVR